MTLDAEVVREKLAAREPRVAFESAAPASIAGRIQSGGTSPERH